LSWLPTLQAKYQDVSLFHECSYSTFPWSKFNFSTHITEGIGTVHTFMGRFYPI
jgi:hypothetical protein